MMKLRILIVDDYPGAADVSCVLVGLLGHEARSAKTAREALDQASSFKPDVVVLDLGLPDVSGYDVARTLRERHGKQPFIAAMTGWGTSADRVQSLVAGIDMHVVKPASVESLGKIIEAAIAKLHGDASTSRA